MHKLYSLLLLSLVICLPAVGALADGPAGFASAGAGGLSAVGASSAVGIGGGFGSTGTAASGMGGGIGSTGMGAAGMGGGNAMTGMGGAGFGIAGMGAAAGVGGATFGAPGMTSGSMGGGGFGLGSVGAGPQGSMNFSVPPASTNSFFPAPVTESGAQNMQQNMLQQNGMQQNMLQQSGMQVNPFTQSGSFLQNNSMLQNSGLPQNGMELQSTGAQQGGIAEGRTAAEFNAASATAQSAMSNAEQMMSAEDDMGMKSKPFQLGKLRQFGYSFFNQPTTFAPVVDVPVGPDYLVGPGDTLVITVWGSLDASLPVEVNRNGEIILPRAGAVRVWGVPFGRVPDLVKAALQKTFRSVNVNVTMGKLRLMRVYLVGEVVSPGGYDVNSLSTVINALAAAGGPTKEGTLRKIQVLRGGHVVDTVDLYNFFLKGDKTRDIRLQPGDTVNVPVHGNLVGIAGNVKKPGIYEFDKESSLEDLLGMAGGIVPSSYLQRVQISRYVANDKKIIADFNLDAKASGKSLDALSGAVRLQDMDVVKVFPIDLTVRNHVQLEGYVLRPGGYALKPKMRVTDVITPEILLPEYCPDTLEITRLVPPDFHPIKLYVSLDQALKGNEKDDILLNEFDTLRVFSRWEMEEMPRVTISGDVQRPGVYRVLSQMTLRDLILAAGNLRKTAYMQSAEVTRSEISKTAVKSRIVNVDLEEVMKGNPKDNLVLANFDEVVIRRVPEWKEETDRYVTLTGQVRFPGVYPIRKGEKLSSVLERAGGYTDQAYLKGAKFTRKLTQAIQQKRMDEVIARSEQDLMRKQQDLTSAAASKDELEATKATLQSMMASLQRLKSAKAEGRIAMQLGPIPELKKSPYDVELQGGDTLDVPLSTNSIMIFGEVYNPTTVVAIPGGTVGEYLKKAGGPTLNADTDEIYVVRADGTVVSKHEMKSFFFDKFNSLKLDSGDTIVVPESLEKVAWMRDLKDIATILGQTALAAGVVVAAGL